MSGALAGLRVIEMVGVGPGPFAAMWLADMGADVIRLSRPGQRWNQTRRDVLNRGRRSLALDLKQEAGLAVARRLIAGADVLIEGFRPGVMERLGLGPEPVAAANPGLVYARITGWGQSGPRRQMAGHDINYLAPSGLLAAIGTAANGPVPPLNLAADFGGGGMFVIAGILAALFERGRSGKGQTIDVAMAEGAAYLGSMIYGYHGKGLWQDRREANLFDGGAPFYRCYECRDGGWVALGAIEPEFWQTFLDRCGVTDRMLREEQTNQALWPEMRARLQAIFRTRDRAEWCALTEGSDACLSAVAGLGEAAEDAQLRDRGALIERDGIVQPAPTPRFSRSTGVIRGPSPMVGEHSRELLVEAGWNETEIEELVSQGVVGTWEPGESHSSAGPVG